MSPAFDPATGRQRDFRRQSDLEIKVAFGRDFVSGCQVEIHALVAQIPRIGRYLAVTDEQSKWRIDAEALPSAPIVRYCQFWIHVLHSTKPSPAQEYAPGHAGPPSEVRSVIVKTA